MTLFAIGIIKKIFIADSIGLYIDPTFEALNSSSNSEILSAFLYSHFKYI